MNKTLVLIFITLSMNVSADNFSSRNKNVNCKNDVLMIETDKDTNCFHHIKLINRVR